MRNVLPGPASVGMRGRLTARKIEKYADALIDNLRQVFLQDGCRDFSSAGERRQALGRATSRSASAVQQRCMTGKRYYRRAKAGQIAIPRHVEEGHRNIIMDMHLTLVDCQRSSYAVQHRQ